MCGERHGSALEPELLGLNFTIWDIMCMLMTRSCHWYTNFALLVILYIVLMHWRYYVLDDINYTRHIRQ